VILAEALAVVGRSSLAGPVSDGCACARLPVLKALKVKSIKIDQLADALAFLANDQRRVTDDHLSPTDDYLCALLT